MANYTTYQTRQYPAFLQPASLIFVNADNQIIGIQKDATNRQTLRWAVEDNKPFYGLFDASNFLECQLLA